MRLSAVLRGALWALSGALWAAWCGVPQNVVTLTSTGAAQISHPVTFAHPFAKGELPNFAMPVVNGTPATYWQNDQIIRHHDGTASCTVTAITNTTPPIVTCAAHGFRSDDEVVISGATPSGYNGRHKITYFTPNKFVLKYATGKGASSGTATATGPGPGSLAWAIISFLVDLPASTSSLAVTFQNSTSRTSDGYGYTSPTGAQILGFNSGNWNAGETYAATGATAYSVDARAMVTAGKYRLWLDGPVAWGVIAEDRTTALSYNFGKTCASDCSGDYSSATWADDASSKALHPYFILTLYRGWAGVKVDYIGELTSYTDLRDQRYTVTFKSGASLETTKYGPTTGTFYARTRWRKQYWDPTAPVTHKTDHGRAFLAYTNTVPNYDPNLPAPTESDIAAQYSAFNGSDQTLGNGNGLLTKNFGETGSHDWVAPQPRWIALWLMSFDPRLEEVAWKQASLFGHVPIHARETNTSAQYLDVNGTGSANNGTGTAFGRPVSVDAHPQLCALRGGGMNWDFGSDKPTFGAPCCSQSDGWSEDFSHFPSTVYAAYLLTGDYFLLEELQLNASWLHVGSNPSVDWSFRHASWGLAPHVYNTRGVAWPERENALAAWVTPDGTPEKDYYYMHFNNQMQRLAGEVRDTNEYFFPTAGWTAANACSSYNKNSSDPSVATAYCHGLATWPGTNPLAFVAKTVDNGQCAEASYAIQVPTAAGCDSPWMQAYRYIAIGMVHRLFPMPGLMQTLSIHTVGIVKHPDFNVYACCAYRNLVIRPDAYYYSDFAELKAALTTTYQTKSSWLTDWWDGVNYSDGYVHIFRSALSFYVPFDRGLVRGREAWDWWKSSANQQFWNYSNTERYSGWFDPKWAINPTFDPVQAPSVVNGDTFAILTYVKPRFDQACTVDGTSDAVTDSRLVHYVRSGLAPSGSGTITIACGADQFGDTVVPYSTLASLSGSGAYTFYAGGGNVRLNHGPTSALGSSTVFADCSAGCTVTMPKGLRYVQFERESGALGETHPILVR